MNHCPIEDNQACAHSTETGTCAECGFDFDIKSTTREIAMRKRDDAELIWSRKRLFNLTQTNQQFSTELKVRPLPAPVVSSLPKSTSGTTGNRFSEQIVQKGSFIGNAPLMTEIQAGKYLRGSAKNATYAQESEFPQREVTIGKAFAMGVNPVTRGEYMQFYEAAGEEQKPPLIKHGFQQTDEHPMVCVSWDDAQAYIKWLNSCTEGGFRLPSESEWEYAARAGTATDYFNGGSITTDDANFSGTQYRKRTTPVGTFEPNPWGLNDVHGNVCEWCEDIWHDNYAGAPTNEMAWITGGDKRRRILRGGSWVHHALNVRVARRFGSVPGNRSLFLGFRLARTLS
jgi:formylglycine-generating enzyme required for sulfatase activity